MMGLAFLVFFAVYLLVSIAAVRGAIGYARKNGKSAKRWGWGTAFIMYSLVFWDWIPTVAVHQYYCAKDSGFWVYKTLDQWKAENPGVMEGLVNNRSEPGTHVGDEVNYINTTFWNERFNSRLKINRIAPPLVIHRHEYEIFDTKSHEVLARQIDFGSHDQGWGGIKFWTSIQRCPSGQSNEINFWKFAQPFKGSLQ